jgi:glycerol-3-phosphate acyltransferase PlsY
VTEDVGRVEPPPRGLPAPVVLGLAYLAGAIPFSNLASRLVAGRDLRDVGTGTVSGTGLYEVAGFGPLAVAGVLEVAGGAVGPLLAGRRRPTLAALAGGSAVVGHDWSAFLAGAGGRGIAPALGATLVQAWPGTVVLGAGLVVGRLAHQSALGSFVGYVALVPALGALRGRRGALIGAALVAPLLAKRVVGNAPPPDPCPPHLWWNRLVYDRDEDAP